MCLTESQCGTDLGLIKTKAIKNNDGSFSLTEKMTKVKLEELGRENGIELDRRLTKAKLVAQLHKAL